MSDTRPELSRNSKYYIPKHRYYELKHFCLQYPLWQDACRSMTELGGTAMEPVGYICKSGVTDPTAKIAIERGKYRKLMNAVEMAASMVEAGDYILKAVTKGLSYTYLEMNTSIPISRDVYYDSYRKFFWILNRIKE